MCEESDLLRGEKRKKNMSKFTTETHSWDDPPSILIGLKPYFKHFRYLLEESSPIDMQYGWIRPMDDGASPLPKQPKIRWLVGP